ncbi:hypothetical protein B1F79_02610 [Coxiella-like endosymbiont of Rhipicephalus sanguineus]|uniref:hypothetical protein n=1 Tax=Coxiella-like endosymbiont of Rhipicephalus sanguineus TaxID=1955402 RepID=UPI00204001BB|nr:hypothetical protein [Coxiella-like endosymbiont of Rhipicephalus sanguineus]MBT8506502.1 hypothetical protein [Coxiella-like endosymbiont of Rhipicephalus sanguineus]
MRFRNFINNNFNLNELHAKWLELIRLKEESRKDKNKKALDNILKSFKLAIESLLDSRQLRQLPCIFREVFKQEYDYGGRPDIKGIDRLVSNLFSTVHVHQLKEEFDENVLMIR